jgi:hypothetical protein
MILALAAPATALAQRETTRDALDHLEETMSLRTEEGLLRTSDVVPAILVSAEPMYEESRHWFPTAVLAALTRVFGAEGVRVCEGCMAPRTFVVEGRLEEATGVVSVADVTRLDESLRGKAPRARTGIWLDETASGVSLRIVDLATSRIIVAENFDPRLLEASRTVRAFSLTRELDRRARGESITNTFVDFALYPGQHVSLDWTEQWGDTNANLSGVSFSLWDPLLGVGGAYYRAIPAAYNALIGVQVMMSLPTALARGISGEDVELVDRILSGIFVVRVPIASSNYGVLFTASTNGNVGLGISLMNMTFLPVLP